MQFGLRSTDDQLRTLIDDLQRSIDKLSMLLQLTELLVRYDRYISGFALFQPAVARVPDGSAGCPKHAAS